MYVFKQDRKTDFIAGGMILILYFLFLYNIYAEKFHVNILYMCGNALRVYCVSVCTRSRREE